MKSRSKSNILPVEVSHTTNVSTSTGIVVKNTKSVNKSTRETAKSLRLEWKEKLLTKVMMCHKRNLSKVVDRILKRADTTKNALVVRSKKYDVECKITVEELRQLLFDFYGTKCKYCDNILTINNLVFDHIIPISKRGSSNIENIQIICKSSNGMKGSLQEDNFELLLNWLETVPDELRRDVSVRLARGVR
jgi:5-methylcytosine-specific restriction endonuclease McrA